MKKYNTNQFSHVDKMHWQACVEMNEICDFSDNCGDGTDEENCGEFTMTNFEVRDNDDDDDDDDDSLSQTV